ncbi:MAG: hypothetical protein V3V50_09225 [Gammaproteobacteria bacterium]
MASLILHPADADWHPDCIDDLHSHLQSIGFIGEVLPENFSQGFLIGDKFLTLATFMGCAPAINLRPDIKHPDHEFCSIRLRLETEVPYLFVAEKYSVPRCPHCRAAVKVDIENIPAETQMTCDQCSESTPLHALNWRRTAGYARCFIEITGVYPQEALPTEALLNVLQKYSDCEWRYFYN